MNILVIQNPEAKTFKNSENSSILRISIAWKIAKVFINRFSCLFAHTYIPGIGKTVLSFSKSIVELSHGWKRHVKEVNETRNQRYQVNIMKCNRKFCGSLASKKEWKKTKEVLQRGAWAKLLKSGCFHKSRERREILQWGN